MTYEVWSTESNRVFTASSRKAVERFAADCAKVSDRTMTSNRQVTQLAEANQALRARNDELIGRLFGANERLERAGSLVGGVVAVTQNMLGDGPIGLDREQVSRGHEAAFRDYIYERGRS